MYIWWLVAYDVKDEKTLWALVIILGIIYLMAASAITMGYPTVASAMVVINVIFMISIAAVSNFTIESSNTSESDGEKKTDYGFIALGTLPIISVICFTSVAGLMSYGMYGVSTALSKR